MAKHQEQPAFAVVQKCGGARALSEALGIDVTTVRRWVMPRAVGGTGGTIPGARAQEIMAWAAKSGVDLSPADFFAI